jgi:hypothetical protein
LWTHWNVQPQEISLQFDKWRDLIQQPQFTHKSTPKIHSNLKLDPASTFSLMAWEGAQLTAGPACVQKETTHNLVDYFTTNLPRKRQWSKRQIATCMKRTVGISLIISVCSKRGHVLQIHLMGSKHTLPRFNVPKERKAPSPVLKF